jgi:ketosteroid isomerase-like protein
MSKTPSILVAVICLGFGLGCQSKPQPAGLSEADHTAIRQAVQEFVNNAKAQPRNDKASAAFYEEDAIMMPPNHPDVRGRAAIEAFLASFPPLSDYQLESLEIDGQGNLAYERGSNSMILTPSSGAPTEWRSKYLVIYRKQADGSWKVSREIFTPDSPPQAAPNPAAPSK